MDESCNGNYDNRYSVPKISMEECKIGNSNIKIYGVAKGSGMIFPNMATTLGYVFTDANLSSNILQKID